MRAYPRVRRTVAASPGRQEDDPVRMPAVLLTVFLSPFLGFLYLGRLKLAFLYLFYGLAVILVFALLYFMDISSLSSMPYGFFYFLLVHAAGALHCANFRAAKPEKKSPEISYRRAALLLSAPMTGLMGLIALITANVTERMQGPSMAPTLQINAPYLVNRYAYRWSDPRRGDIILFTTRTGKSTIQRMSRIIGLPGDRVAMRMGVPVINGEPLERHRLADCDFSTGFQTYPLPCFMERLPEGGTYTAIAQSAPGTGRFDNHPERTVPEGSYYVIGDNRDAARDSRDVQKVGFVSAAQIQGHVYVPKVTPDLSARLTGAY